MMLSPKKGIANVALLPIFSLLFILLTVPSTIEAIRRTEYYQRVTLYSGNQSTGDSYTLNEIYAPNLQPQKFSKRVNSVCATGVWLFYTTSNWYNRYGSATEVVFGGGPNPACVDLKQHPNNVDSIRFVGNSKDYRVDSITFYQNQNFQNNEEYTETGVNYLTLVYLPNSLIVNGQGSWTLYELQGHKGKSFCLEPHFLRSHNDENSPTLIYNTSVFRFGIRSVAKGCVDK